MLLRCWSTGPGGKLVHVKEVVTSSFNCHLFFWLNVNEQYEHTLPSTKKTSYSVMSKMHCSDLLLSF